MQNVRENSPSFNARIIFMDKGKCFSIGQKLNLKSLAKQIGTSEDRFYVGTRKYKYISAIDGKTRYECKDMQILSSVNGVNHDYRCMHRNVQDEIERETSNFFYDLPKKERWKRFNENVYNNIKGFLETYNESVPKESSRAGGRTANETRKLFKNEILEFSKLKSLNPKKTLKQRLNSLLFNDDTVIQSTSTEPFLCKSDKSALIDENPYDVLVKPFVDVISDSFKI